MNAKGPILLSAAACCVLFVSPVRAQLAQASAQGSDPRAVSMLRAAVQSELTAAERDHSTWTWREHNVTPEKDATYLGVESPQGTVRRLVELSGRPVDSATQQQETQNIRGFVHDPDAQARQRKAGAHDDAQARQMLLMLPSAYFWTIKSETPELVTLAFRPNPNFKPPNIEARVMSAMTGEMGIARADNRIRTLRGALTYDIKIGYGLFGRLKQGGTFDIERREIGPHIWQITESRVHIDGKALLFKTIGQQEDDIKTDWKPSTAHSLEEAAHQLGVD